MTPITRWHIITGNSDHPETPLKRLREVIKHMILEVYELSDEDKETLEFYRKKAGSLGRDGRRAIGLQSKQEIQDDRKWMQRVQNLMGRDGVKSFMDRMHIGGDFTVFHSIRYSGAAAAANSIRSIEGFDKGGSPEAWIKKHGRKGKDTLSCVGVTKPVDKVNASDYRQGNNSYKVLGAPNTMGFIMKGYPVMVAKNDVMSQTLSALPKGLVQHQKNSGISKRGGTGSFFYMNYDELLTHVKSGETLAADEVLLDNWEIIGLYAHFERDPDMELSPNIHELDKKWDEICSYFETQKGCMKYLNLAMLDAWDGISDDKLIELGIDWARHDRSYDGLLKIIDEAYEWHKMINDYHKEAHDDVLKPMYVAHCKNSLQKELENKWRIYTRGTKKHPIAKPSLRKEMERIAENLGLPVFFL